jgi:hypothetical protein
MKASPFFSPIADFVNFSTSAKLRQTGMKTLKTGGAVCADFINKHVSET